MVREKRQPFSSGDLQRLEGASGHHRSLERLFGACPHFCMPCVQLSFTAVSSADYQWAQVWHQNLYYIARKSQQPRMDPALGPSAGKIQQTLTQAPGCSWMLWLRTHSRQGGWGFCSDPFWTFYLQLPPIVQVYVPQQSPYHSDL